MKRNVFAALALLMLCAMSASAQNRAANPGFELPTSTTTSVGNWFRFGSGANGFAEDSTVMPRSGQGHEAITVIGANQFGGVFQNVGVVNPGAVVTFTGWAKNAAGIPFNATQEIKLEWQGAPQNRVDVLTLTDNYTQFTHTGVAPAGTTGLVVTYALSTFGPGQGNSLVYLDDIDVRIIPEPATVGLLGLGSLAFVGLARRRRK